MPNTTLAVARGCGRRVRRRLSPSVRRCGFREHPRPRRKTSAATTAKAKRARAATRHARSGCQLLSQLHAHDAHARCTRCEYPCSTSSSSPCTCTSVSVSTLSAFRLRHPGPPRKCYSLLCASLVRISPPVAEANRGERRDLQGNASSSSLFVRNVSAFGVVGVLASHSRARRQVGEEGP